MKKRNIGRWILSLLAVFTALGPYGADWNETHIYNPKWTPHAKFHNAQTMLMGTMMGLFSLFYLWRKQGNPEQNLQVATIFGALYYVTQGGSILFPGTAAVDPEFADGLPKIAGVTLTQPMGTIPLLLIIGGAYLLQKQSMKQ